MAFDLPIILANSFNSEGKPEEAYPIGWARPEGDAGYTLEGNGGFRLSEPDFGV